MTAIKSFKQMRLDGDTKRGESIQALLEDIHEEPGFNVRIKDADFEKSVEELAEFLANGGVVPPLEVRPRPGGGVWLVDGHRRRSAYLLLDSQGRLPRTPRKSDPSVLEAWIDVKPFVGNDAERVLRLATSNANKPLSAVELCNVYTQLLAFKWTPEQIAKKLGKPVSHVKMILDLAGGNTDVHELVQAKAVSPTIAAETVRKHGDAAGGVLKDQLATAKAAGKSKVTAATTKPKAATVDAYMVWDSVGGVGVVFENSRDAEHAATGKNSAYTTINGTSALGEDWRNQLDDPEQQFVVTTIKVPAPVDTP